MLWSLRSYVMASAPIYPYERVIRLFFITSLLFVFSNIVFRVSMTGIQVVLSTGLAAYSLAKLLVSSPSFTSITRLCIFRCGVDIILLITRILVHCTFVLVFGQLLLALVFQFLFVSS